MPGYKPETWNPIVGCSKVSPGCDNCYAEKFAFRIVNMLEKSKSETYHVYKNAATKSGWTGRTALNTDHIDKPLQWKSPRMVFVCSMGDLFHENVPFTWIDQVFEVIVDCTEHIFIILTKRPERMKEYMDYRIANGKYYNYSWVWLGVTAENQEQADKRIPILLKIPAAKRFVSIEPMLGPVKLTAIRQFDGKGIHIASYQVLEPITTAKDSNRPALDWVICGGESGPKARPMHPEWVRSVRDQCEAAGTPFFFKQWGEWKPFEKGDQCKRLFSWATDTERNMKIVTKVGRKAAGNLLDGKQHHNWPII